MLAVRLENSKGSGGGKRSRHEEVSGKSIPGKGKSNGKALRKEHAWCVQGRARR